MANCGIYKISNNINDKVYIGQSIDIQQRWRDHKSSFLHNKQNLIYKAMREIGYEHFIFEIIELCPPQDLDERERYWIQFYNSFENGYNATLGGAAESAEQQQKEVQQYTLQGEYIKSYCSASEAARQLNLKLSDLTAACRGVSSQCGGFQWKYTNDKKEITLAPEKNGKIVIQYDKKTYKELARYTSIQTAEKINHIVPGSIGKVCNGHRKTADGYIWRFQGEELSSE